MAPENQKRLRVGGVLIFALFWRSTATGAYRIIPVPSVLFFSSIFASFSAGRFSRTLTSRRWSISSIKAAYRMPFGRCVHNSSACRMSLRKFRKALRSLGVLGTLTRILPAGDCNRTCFPPQWNDHPWRISCLTNRSISFAEQYCMR